MSSNAKWEYLRAVYPRYQQASRAERGRILDEFCRVLGYHRKYAVRVLNGPAPPAVRPSRPRRRRTLYTAATIDALVAIWTAAGYPWSLRLKALVPLWLPWARRRLRLTRLVERQLLAISPRQIDRRLGPHRRQLAKRLYGRTKPGTLLKHHIPIKTDTWAVTTPGFTEIDLVSHSGDSGEGDFLHSLNVTDIHTTWVETRAVQGKSQAAVQAALEDLRRALPFPLRGIDSDNGSEFVNLHLYAYCQRAGIQFTRGRPYQKDDNAHIEQKNWTHVRKLLGYVRYDTPAALTAINDLYGHELRWLQNLFLPSVKLLRKERVGARLRRRYDAPRTPLERVLAATDVDAAALARLTALRARLDPFALAEAVDRKLEAIYALATRVAPSTAPPAAAAPRPPVVTVHRRQLRRLAPMRFGKAAREAPAPVASRQPVTSKVAR